ATATAARLRGFAAAFGGAFFAPVAFRFVVDINHSHPLAAAGIVQTSPGRPGEDSERRVDHRAPCSSSSSYPTQPGKPHHTEIDEIAPSRARAEVWPHVRTASMARDARPVQEAENRLERFN